MKSKAKSSIVLCIILSTLLIASLLPDIILAQETIHGAPNDTLGVWLYSAGTTEPAGAPTDDIVERAIFYDLFDFIGDTAEEVYDFGYGPSEPNPGYEDTTLAEVIEGLSAIDDFGLIAFTNDDFANFDTGRSGYFLGGFDPATQLAVLPDGIPATGTLGPSQAPTREEAIAALDGCELFIFEDAELSGMFITLSNTLGLTIIIDIEDLQVDPPTPYGADDTLIAIDLDTLEGFDGTFIDTIQIQDDGITSPSMYGDTTLEIDAVAIRTTGLPPGEPDYRISVSASFQVVNPGESVSYEVSLTPLNGFDYEVYFFSGWIGTPPAKGSPLRKFDPWHLTPPGISTFTVTTFDNTQLGRFTLEIIAVSGSITHSVEVTLTVALEIYKVAYITVVYSDTQPGRVRPFNEMESKADFVETYYRSQSMGAVALESHFPLEDWIALGKTFEEYGPPPLRPGQWWWGLWPPPISFQNYWNSIVDDAKTLAGIDDDDYDAIVIIQPEPVVPFTFQDMGALGKIIMLASHYGYGIWAHELGHALFKFSDYYSEGISGILLAGDIGYWGLMGRGPDLDPPAPIMSWNRINAGWLSKTYVNYGEHPIDLLENMKLNDEVVFFTTWVNYDYMFEGRLPPDGVYDPEPSSEGTLEKTKGIALYKITGWPLTKVFMIPNLEDDDRVTLTPGGDPYLDDRMGVEFSSITKGSEEDLYINIESCSIFDRIVVALESIEFEIPDISSSFAPVDSGSTLDVDLYAFTADGQRVGMDYSSGAYEIGIQDARASGNIHGAGPEWISLPDDISAYFAIDATPAMEFAQEQNITITSITAHVSVVHYDEFGGRSQSETVPISVNLEEPTVLSSIDVTKVFKPETIGSERRGAVMTRTNITNVGELDITELNFEDEILDGWVVKQIHMVSAILLIDGEEYEIPYEDLNDVALENGRYVVSINFTGGIDLYQYDPELEQEIYAVTIYAFEPEWVLEVKYPVHPLRGLEPNDYPATVSVMIVSPEGISVTVEDAATLYVR